MKPETWGTASQVAIPHSLLRSLAMGHVAYTMCSRSVSPPVYVRVERWDNSTVAVEWGTLDAGIPVRETFASLWKAVVFLTDHDLLGTAWHPFRP